MSYTLSIKNKTYIDISLAFQPSPVTGDITVLTNDRAINNSLKNIILTLVSEVPFFRDFGSRTNAYLFDFIDEANALLLEDEIERAILFGEPRVAFVQNKISSDLDFSYETDNRSRRISPAVFGMDLGVKVEAHPDANEYAVTVTYLIVGTDRIFNVEMLLTPTR